MHKSPGVKIDPTLGQSLVLLIYVSPKPQGLELRIIWPETLYSGSLQRLFKLLPQGQNWPIMAPGLVLPLKWSHEAIYSGELIRPKWSSCSCCLVQSTGDIILGSLFFPLSICLSVTKLVQSTSWNYWCDFIQEWSGPSLVVHVNGIFLYNDFCQELWPLNDFNF